MIDTDDKEGTLPVKHTTCSQCNRLVHSDHVDLDGLCSECSKPSFISEPGKHGGTGPGNSNPKEKEPSEGG